MVVFHVGTNDLTNSVDTRENLTKLLKYVDENLLETEIAMSSIITRTDRKDLEKKVTILNKQIAEFCTENSLKLIDHANITHKHLSKKKLHLDAKGSSILANNFLKFLRLELIDSWRNFTKCHS